MLLFQNILDHFVRNSTEYCKYHDQSNMHNITEYMTEDNILRYICCILAMGISTNPHINFYWSTDEFGLFGNNYIKHILSWNMFWNINRGF